MDTLMRLLLVLTFLCAMANPLRAQAARVPLLLDTDIGDDIDDAFALALAANHPRLELCGVTTVAGPLDHSAIKDPATRERLKSQKNGDAFSRALVASRFLQEIGRRNVPVVSGESAWEPHVPWSKQFSYGSAIELRERPRDGAIEFLYEQLKARPGQLILVAIG